MSYDIPPCIQSYATFDRSHPVSFSDFTPCRKRIFKTTAMIKAAVLKFLKVSVSENAKDLKVSLGNLLSLRSKDKNFLETSLVVQWLRHCASTAGAGMSLIPGLELRSHVLKKKKKSEKKSLTDNSKNSFLFKVRRRCLWNFSVSGNNITHVVKFSLIIITRRHSQSEKNAKLIFPKWVLLTGKVSSML